MAFMCMDVVYPSMVYKYKLNCLTMTNACLDHKHGISYLQCLIIIIIFVLQFISCFLRFFFVLVYKFHKNY